MSLRPTIHDPIDGMIENTGRYIKKIGGKKYLVYLETIAQQVKLSDGRSVQDLSDTVEEFFRLSKEYVAQLAQAAKQSEDNAKASEVSAKASEAAANASKVAAAASEANAKASELAAKGSENAAAASEAAAKASEIVAKASELAAHASQVAAAASQRACAAAQTECQNLAIGVLSPYVVEQAIQRATERVVELLQNLPAQLQALEERLVGRISADETSHLYQISNLSRVIARHEQIIHEDEQRFNEKQINDVERFSNLSYASVVHTRKILEITEEATAELVNRLVCTSRMCLLHIMDYLDGVKDYIASISSHGVDQHVQPDGTTTTANQMNFVGDDGTVVPLTALTLNRS